MTEIRYAGLVQAPQRLVVNSVGATNATGWQLVHVLPATSMPSGAREYAILVQGQFSNRQTAGTGQQSGVLQVCLGLTDGTRFTNYRASHTITQALPADEGIPFQFLVLIQSGIPDVLLGSSFNPAAGELCLWARTYTNGDPQTYSASFEVEGLSWLWWDLTAIPSGHWTCGRSLPPAGSPIVLANRGDHLMLSSAFGAPGQTWLCFQNVFYEPRVHNQPAPQFLMGPASDGTMVTFVPRIGSAGWGMSRVAAGPPAGFQTEFAQLQQGGFYTVELTTSTTRIYIDPWAPAPCVAWVRRAHWFAVRIDTLADMRRNSFGVVAAGGPMTTDAWRTTSLALERPAVGTIVEPIVMAHGVARLLPGQFGGCALRVLEAGTDAWFGQTAAPQIDAGRFEGASGMAFGRRVFQVGSPAIQWRLTHASSANTPAAPQTLVDGELVAFHPVRDPENTTTPPGSLPSPIILVPDRQAPDVGSLAQPPHRPSAARPQRARDERPAIRGSTGYRRSWPLGASVLRELSLQWGPMPRAEGQAVFDFLRANQVWAYLPPTGALVAVGNLGNPELVAADHRNVTVAIDVALLTWTGP